MDLLKRWRGGLIVSCQALEGEPMQGPMLVAAMARAAALGGAVGIRTNGCEEVDVCKKITGLPIIGIKKVNYPERGLCITPTFAHAQALAKAGADMVAVDVRTVRGGGEPLDELIPRIRQELGLPVMADCATVDDAEQAVRIGVDVLSTTFGFRRNALGIEPDFGLLSELVTLPCPVIAEGGYWTPEQVLRALDIGALAVVVGTAITRPQDITRRFVTALEQRTKIKREG